MNDRTSRPSTSKPTQALDAASNGKASVLANLFEKTDDNTPEASEGTEAPSLTLAVPEDVLLDLELDKPTDDEVTAPTVRLASTPDDDDPDEAADSAVPDEIPDDVAAAILAAGIPIDAPELRDADPLAPRPRVSDSESSLGAERTNKSVGAREPAAAPDQGGTPDADRLRPVASVGTRTLNVAPPASAAPATAAVSSAADLLRGQRPSRFLRPQQTEARLPASTAPRAPERIGSGRLEAAKPRWRPGDPFNAPAKNPRERFRWELMLTTACGTAACGLAGIWLLRQLFS